MIVRHRLLVAASTLALASTVAACTGSSGGSDGSAGKDQPTRTTAPPDRSDAAPRTTTVFRGGDDGYASFRIPAVVRTADGTLVAFAEGRRTSAADDGDVDLVEKRSDDDGRTWGPLQVVAEDGEDFVGNPAPVVDPASGRIVLLAIHKDGDDTEIEILTGEGEDTSRVWLLSSPDDGASWSRPTDLTDEVKRDTWRWYAVGPGHAIALRHGDQAGRLVVAASHTDATAGAGNHALVSDDGGRTWEIGAVAEPGGSDHPDENAVAELDDGTLVFLSRNQNEGATWHRLRATSTDGGETFATPYAPVVGLEVPVVQGSTLWADDRLLFSAPADQHVRTDLTVRSSDDGGVTWSEGTLVAAGPSGYSDLVALGDGRVGVLAEAGERDSAERIDLTVLGADRIG